MFMGVVASVLNTMDGVSQLSQPVLVLIWSCQNLIKISGVRFLPFDLT